LKCKKIIYIVHIQKTTTLPANTFPAQMSHLVLRPKPDAHRMYVQD
jgi:hypothetical protein